MAAIFFSIFFRHRNKCTKFSEYKFYGKREIPWHFSIECCHPGNPFPQKIWDKTHLVSQFAKKCNPGHITTDQKSPNSIILAAECGNGKQHCSEPRCLVLTAVKVPLQNHQPYCTAVCYAANDHVNDKGGGHNTPPPSTADLAGLADRFWTSRRHLHSHTSTHTCSCIHAHMAIYSFLCFRCKTADSVLKVNTKGISEFITDKILTWISNAYRTTRRQTNSRSVKSRTG